MNPRDDVQRCGSASDCEGSGDNRYEAICVFPEGSTLDSTEVDKICVAQFKAQTCDPMAIIAGNMEHPLAVALEQAKSSTRYLCAMEQLGLQGCPPRTAEPVCDGSMQPQNGFCDEPDGDAQNIAGNADLEAQDVLDQFCRSYFCDESFVCDRESATCVPCNFEQEREFGFGGCGTVYTGGVPSCIYTDAEEACDAPDSDQNDPNFGTCTM